MRHGAQLGRLDAELAHAFLSVRPTGYRHHGPFADTTISLGIKYPWFLNSWQAALAPPQESGSPLHHRNHSPAPPESGSHLLTQYHVWPPQMRESTYHRDTLQTPMTVMTQTKTRIQEQLNTAMESMMIVTESRMKAPLLIKPPGILISTAMARVPMPLP